MIKVRYNFETNSSSMHSLSIRKTEGQYPESELRHSDNIYEQPQQDCILITNQDGVYENMHHGMHVYKDTVSIWYHDLEFRNAPFEVLSTFIGKVRYALATIMERKTRGWEKRKQEVFDIFHKYFPNYELEIDKWHSDAGDVSIPFLFGFLKERKISLEDFLTNQKYLVVINYEEYCNMKYLNMVDESIVVEEYHPLSNVENRLNIVNGVWKMGENELSFGRSPFRVLGSVEGKARYALAAHHCENIDEVIEILQEVIPELESIELYVHHWSWSNEDEVETGWVDDGGVIPRDVSLREFILDKKYVIISDGDEYCAFKSFKDAGVFNTEEYTDDDIYYNEDMYEN